MILAVAVVPRPCCRAEAAPVGGCAGARRCRCSPSAPRVSMHTSRQPTAPMATSMKHTRVRGAEGRRAPGGAPTAPPSRASPASEPGLARRARRVRRSWIMAMPHRLAHAPRVVGRGGGTARHRNFLFSRRNVSGGARRGCVHRASVVRRSGRDRRAGARPILRRAAHWLNGSQRGGRSTKNTPRKCGDHRRKRNSPSPTRLLILLDNAAPEDGRLLPFVPFLQAGLPSPPRQPSGGRPAASFRP